MVKFNEALKSADNLDNLYNSGYPVRMIRRTKDYKNFKKYCQERGKC